MYDEELSKMHFTLQPVHIFTKAKPLMTSAIFE